MTQEKRKNTRNTTKPKLGRPSVFTDELAIEICSRLASGEALVKICREEAMPGLTTVYRWLHDNEAFRKMYMRAREDQADTLADEIVAIADEECTTVRADKHPGSNADDEGNVEVVFDSSAVARNRLRVDARKWIASKLKPKVYSERTTLQNPDGTAVNVVPVINMTVLPPSEGKT